MKTLKNIFRMAMVAFAAIAVTACGEKDPVGGGNEDSNDDHNSPVVTPTELYSEWLGDWVLTGDNKVSNSISISEAVVDKSINLKGLMNLPLTIVGEYSTERNDIIFYSQVVEKNYSFSGGQVGNIYLLGLDRDGMVRDLSGGEYGIAIAGVIDGGQRALVRYGVNVSDYPKFVAMILIAEIGDKFYSLDTGAGDKTNIPAFNAIATIDATTKTLSVEDVQIIRSESYEVLRLGDEITHLVR